MTENTYFFDTYAIMEVLVGNENYRDYAGKYIVLTKLNIFEMYYIVLRDFGENKAKEAFDRYYGSAVDYGPEVIKEAAEFRLENKKKNLSMTDCIGYIISKKLRIRFLTGDKEFERMKNVEFVK